MKITFIGAGNMGRAIIAGLIKNNVFKPKDITASDTNMEALKKFAEQTNINITDDNVAAVKKADAIVIAVKPQSLNDVLPPLRGKIDPKAVLISICAGAPMLKFVDHTQHRTIVRAMPNTPAQISMGVTVWTSQGASWEQKALAQTVLDAMGSNFYVDTEDDIDKATALSGSGPAYVFLIAESFIKAGIELGLKEDLVKDLVINTIIGSSAYAKKSGLPLSTLKENVTSKGGTTEAALNEFKQSNMDEIISSAIKAAYHRVVELGKV